MKTNGTRKWISLVMAALALSAVAFSAPSCRGEEGGKTPGAGRDGEIQVEVDDQSDVDLFLKSLDEAMETINPDEFSDSKLGESELGL